MTSHVTKIEKTLKHPTGSALVRWLCSCGKKSDFGPDPKRVHLSAWAHRVGSSL